MRHSWVIAVIILTLSLTACAASKQTKDTLQLNTGRIDSMSTSMGALRNDVDKLNYNIRSIDVKITSFEKKINMLTDDGARAMGSQELETIKGQLFDLDQRLSEIENSGIFPTEQQQTPISMGVSGNATSGFTIKVLSATGDLGPAKAFSKQLKEAGYNVKRIDLAQSPFRRNTVFYSKGMRDAAEEVAGQMDARPTVKPLTWGSTFKIIVVVTH